MSAKQTIQRNGRPSALAACTGIAIAAMLCACGGGEDAVMKELSAQQQKESAALARAHQLNAEAMSKITAERSAGQAQRN